MGAISMGLGSSARLGAIAATVLCAAVSTGAAEEVSFKEDIFPIIQIRCLGCHQPEGEGFEKSGLDLRTYEGLMRGTRHGSMVVPGDAFVSNLNVMIEGRADRALRMPLHRRKLSSCDTDLFRKWVNQGARDN